MSGCITQFATSTVCPPMKSYSLCLQLFYLRVAEQPSLLWWHIVSSSKLQSRWDTISRSFNLCSCSWRRKQAGLCHHRHVPREWVAVTCHLAQALCCPGPELTCPAEGVTRQSSSSGPQHLKRLREPPYTAQRRSHFFRIHEVAG